MYARPMMKSTIAASDLDGLTQLTIPTHCKEILELPMLRSFKHFKYRQLAAEEQFEMVLHLVWNFCFFSFYQVFQTFDPRNQECLLMPLKIIR